MSAVVNSELMQGWFRVEEMEEGLFLIEEPLHDEVVKSYLVVGRERALLVDAGTGAGDMPALVGRLTDRPLTLVVSHAHWDHIGHAAAFAAAGVAVLATAEQAPALAAGVGNAKLRAAFAPHRLTGSLPHGFDPATATFPPVRASALLADGDRFALGGWSLEVLVGGGHTPGLATLVDRHRGVLFSTDAVYAEAPLYAQFDDSDLPAYLAEMERLAALAPHLMRLYPSHGPAPIAPTFITRTLDALREILAGRTPDAVPGGVAAHRFDGLTVLVPVAGG